MAPRSPFQGAAPAAKDTAGWFRGSPGIEDLPSPPSGKTGWPWTEDCCPLPVEGSLQHRWPLLSIITPSFNQGRFLEETIRSVLLQGYPHLQYIIVDGGSTDGTVEVIERYSSWVSSWVSEPDGGQAEAINKGFRRASGDIVAWINSDDTYPRDAVVQAVTFLMENPSCDLVYGHCNMVDERGWTLWTWLSGVFGVQRQLCEGNIIPQPTVFLRRSVLERAGLLSEGLHYAFDVEFWLRVALVAEIHNLPRILANFRFHPSSKSVSEAGEFRNETERILMEFFARPDLPGELMGLRERALTGSNLRSAREWFREGNMVECRKAFQKALSVAPGQALLSRVFPLFLLSLTGGTFCNMLLSRARSRYASPR
jgi:glycosyltransferase involved in cell wall biosynthesis